MRRVFAGLGFIRGLFVLLFFAPIIVVGGVLEILSGGVAFIGRGIGRGIERALLWTMDTVIDRQPLNRSGDRK